MTRRDVAILGIRFAALYAWFEALEFLAGGFFGMIAVQSAFGKSPNPIAWLALLLPLLLFVYGGFFLFTRAQRLADYFFPELEESSATPVASSSAPSVGFAIVGLAGFIFSVPHLFQMIASLLRSNQFNGPHGYPIQQSALLLQMAGVLPQVILSLAIFLKAQSLATWWQRKQTQDGSSSLRP